MGNQDFAVFDDLFSDLGTEFSPELREKEITAAAARPLGDAADSPEPAAPQESPGDEGYDIDALLGELDGGGVAPVMESAPQYLDLGAAPPPAESAAPIDDFASSQESVSTPPPVEPQPTGGDELDALLGDFGTGVQASAASEPPSEISEAEALDDLLGDFGAASAEPQATEEQVEVEEGMDLDSLLSREEYKAAAAAAEEPSPADLPGEAGEYPAETASSAAEGDDETTSFLQELEHSDTEEPAVEEGLSEDLEFGGEMPSGEDLGFEDFSPPEMEGEGELGPAEQELPGEDLFEEAAMLAAPTEQPPSFDIEGEEELELTGEDLLRIQKRILILTPELQERVRSAIVEYSIPAAAQTMLVRMLLAGRTPQEIRDFIQQQTGETIVEESMDAFLEEERATTAQKAGGALENLLPMLRISALLGGIIILGLFLFLLVIKPGIDARSNYNKGLTEISRGHWADAERYFIRGEGYGGKDIDWYINYGLAYRKQKEWPRAIKKFKDGLKVEPEHFRAWLLLGETYALKGGKYDIGKAQTVFRNMLRRFPDSLRVLEKIGDLYVILGDRSRSKGDVKKARAYYEEGKGYYTRLIKKEWDDPGGQFKMLRVYSRLDEYRLVGLKLNQINRIRKDALDVPIYTEIAAYYQSKKRWSRSAKLLKKVLKKDWQYALAHYYIGLFYREQRDWPRATDYLKRAIHFNGRDARFHNDLGEVYLSYPEPSLESASSSFEKARALNRPGYYKPSLNLAFLFYEKFSEGHVGDRVDQDYNTALTNFIAASMDIQSKSVFPADVDMMRYYYYFGWLYYRQNRIQKALELWERIYAMNLFHPVISFAMGNAYLHLNKYALAIPEFHKGILYYSRIARRISEINPANSRHRKVVQALSFNYNNLGVAYVYKHRSTGEVEWEQKALQSFYKARELGDKLNDGKGGDNDFFWNNINYVLKPGYKSGLAIAPERNNKSELAKFLSYPRS